METPDCVEIVPIGADWFRIHSTINRHNSVAVTGAELRAFLRQVKAGHFDELTGLEPVTEQLPAVSRPVMWPVA